MLAPLGTYEISRGKKHFELSNHLGNVLAVVSDKKLPQCAVQNKYDQPFTNTTGSWTAAGAGVSFVHENNRLKVTNTSTYIPVRSPNITGLTVGKRYVLTIDLERNSTSVVNAYLRWGTSSILYVRWMGAPGPVSYSIEFVPQTTSIQVELQGSTGIYYVDRVQVNEAEEEAGTYVSARAEVIQTGDYSPFGAPLANRDYKPIDEQNRNIIINTTYNEGTDGWVPASGTTLGNSLGRLQFLTYSATAQSAQKVYAGLLTIGKKYRVSFDFIIDGITTATYTVTNGSTNVGTKLQSITTREVVEFTATSTNLTLMITLSAGNYGRLAHIDNLEVAEIAEIGEGYRFGFNGMEKDNDTYGEGNALDFGARIYDSRLGRWLSLDRLMSKYPFVNPYNGMLNSPLQYKDINGEDIILTIMGNDNKAKTAVIIKTDLVNITYNLPFNESQFPNGTFREPFTIDGPNASDIKEAAPDATLISFDAGVAAGGGGTLSVQIALIHKGEDAGGIFLYDGFGVSAGFNAGASVTVGEVEFNEANSKGIKLNRATFMGKSQGLGWGLGALSGGEITSYTDGEWCTGGIDNCSDQLFNARMVGEGTGMEIGAAYSWTDNGDDKPVVILEPQKSKASNTR